MMTSTEVLRLIEKRAYFTARIDAIKESWFKRILPWNRWLVEDLTKEIRLIEDVLWPGGSPWMRPGIITNGWLCDDTNRDR